MVSTSWSPMLKSGLRLVRGSWKIIPIRRPRTPRIASSDSPVDTLSAEADLAPGDAAGGSTRPMIAAPVTDLPAPDSPTTPRTSPLAISNETPSIAVNTPRRRCKLTRRSRIERMGASPPPEETGTGLKRRSRWLGTTSCVGAESKSEPGRAGSVHGLQSSKSQGMARTGVPDGGRRLGRRLSCSPVAPRRKHMSLADALMQVSVPTGRLDPVAQGLQEHSPLRAAPRSTPGRPRSRAGR